MIRIFLSIALEFFILQIVFAQTETISNRQVVSGLTTPVDIVFDQDNIMHVVEKRGKIKRITFDTEPVKVEDILDITSKVNSGATERGLLGLAFHPQYKSNGFIFVNYTNSTGATVIERYTVENNKGNVTTAKEIMKISQPYNNHNGGDLIFGKDGFLYIAMGDGGSGGDPQNYSQRPKERLGKMLRIDIDTDVQPYLIPDSNPFKNNVDTLPEIWALGLRNPWKISFDQLTGDMWIGDVGQNKFEEIDFEPANIKGGLNYGWRCYEGNSTYNTSNCLPGSSYVKPVHTYVTNSAGDGCSVTGGHVYRGNTIGTLSGKYVFGDFCTGNVWYLEKDGNNYMAKKFMNVGPQKLSTFGQDNDGEMYYADYGDGIIHKFTSTTSISDVAIENLSLFPNPVNDVLSINLEGNIQVEILNQLGQKLFTSNSNKINVKQLNIGTYFALVKKDGILYKGQFKVVR